MILTIFIPKEVAPLLLKFKPARAKDNGMEEDEEDLRQPKGWSTLDLEDLSIDQLEKYIAELEAEIQRVHLDIKEKTVHANVAENFFKKS